MTELLKNHLDVSPNELADRDPQHFLSQTFDIHDRAKDKSSTLMVAVRKDSALLQHARCQRLHCEEVKAPESYLKDPRYPYMVLIARSEPDLSGNKEWNVLMEEMGVEIEKARKEREEPERVQRLTGEGEWHVSGAYEITSPLLHRFSSDKVFKLEIYSQGTGASAQLFAEVDFRILSGVMRFERQEELDSESHRRSSSWSPIERASLSKKRSYFEFEEDSMYEPVEERTSEENFEGAPIDEQFDDDNEMAEEDDIPEGFRLGSIKWLSQSNTNRLINIQHISNPIPRELIQTRLRRPIKK